jgi:hypothetical protein
MKRPSPAMTVALIALFVALTGSAAAGSGLITGAQIKDHSIGINDLALSAVSKLRGHAGPAGAAGPSGPAGPAGAPGGFDPSKISYVDGPQTDLPANAAAGAQSLTATCPSGTKVVGGGGFPNIALEGASLANPDGSGWTLVVVNDTDVDIPNAFAFAVCAAP